MGAVALRWATAQVQHLSCSGGAKAPCSMPGYDGVLPPPSRRLRELEAEAAEGCAGEAAAGEAKAADADGTGRRGGEGEVSAWTR